MEISSTAGPAGADCGLAAGETAASETAARQATTMRANDPNPCGFRTAPPTAV